MTGQVSVKIGSHFRIFVSVFVAVLLAIAVAVYIFAPERFPAGVGLNPCPINISYRHAFLVQNGYVVSFSNPTGETLHNVTVICERQHSRKTFLREEMRPVSSFEIGWMEGWQWAMGDSITVSAGGYGAVAKVLQK